MQARQQQQQESAQPRQQQLGSPDLQQNIIDHLHGKHVLIFVITVSAHGQHLAIHHTFYNTSEMSSGSLKQPQAFTR